MQNDENRPGKTPISRNELVVPIVSNILLLIVATSILWGAFIVYSNDLAVQTTAGERYLTMQWNLLQELKSQTDAQLREKDSEIAALRRRYAQLAAQETASADREALGRLEQQLATAEGERDSLLRGRIEIATPEPEKRETSLTDNDETQIDNSPPATAVPVERVTIGASTRVTELLRREIESLRSQVIEKEIAEQQLRASLAEAQSYIATVQERMRGAVDRISPRSVTIDPRTNPESPDTAQQSTIEMINTRTLLRAIMTEPEIRNQYPELMRQVDRYIATVEARARQDGQQITYNSTSAAIEAYASELEISISSSLPPDTSQGYVDRLAKLITKTVTIASPDDPETNLQ